MELISEEIMAKVFLKLTKTACTDSGSTTYQRRTNTTKTTPRYMIAKPRKGREGSDNTVMLTLNRNDALKTM